MADQGLHPDYGRYLRGEISQDEYADSLADRVDTAVSRTDTRYDPRCTCDPLRPEGRPWYAHQPGCPLRNSGRWQGHGDLIRTQLQETGRVRLSFITLADLWTAVDDLGIDPTEVGFYGGYATVGDSWKSIDSKRDIL